MLTSRNKSRFINFHFFLFIYLSIPIFVKHSKTIYNLYFKNAFKKNIYILSVTIIYFKTKNYKNNDSNLILKHMEIKWSIFILK